jgi:hypothetical protein
LRIVDVIDFITQYLPVYRAGFIHNLKILKPVKNEQYDRVINGDAVKHFATLARVETGGHWWFSLRAIYVLDFKNYHLKFAIDGSPIWSKSASTSTL